MEAVASELAETKQALAARTVEARLRGSDVPLWPSGGYRTLADEGYRKNEIAFACINLLMRTFSEAPVSIVDANGEPTSGLLRSVMDRPNPFLSEQELWETYVLHRRLAGNFFLEKVRSSAGRVVELWPLSPDRVGIVPDPEEFIAGYTYEVGGERFPLDRRDVIHLRAPNPLDPYFGMPDLRAALHATALDNEMTAMTKVIAQNRGVNPGTVITTQESNFSDEGRWERMRRKWIERFHQAGRGGVAFLLKGMDVKTIGMPMNELAWPDLRDVTEARICGALEVPPIMVGANVGLKRSTYANYEEARLSLWMETIAPDHRKVASKLQSDPDFAPERGGRITFDTSQVHALKEVRNRVFDRATAGVGQGWLTVNDGRSLVGMQAVDGGDVFLRGLAVREVPLRPEPAPEPRPDPATRRPAPAEATPRAPESEEQVEEGETAQKEIVLNGAQVQALVQIVQQVATEQLPRASAVEIIVAAFGLGRERAEAILGEAGRGFRPSLPATEAETRSAVLRHVKQLPEWAEAKAVSRDRAVAQIRTALGRRDQALTFLDGLEEWAKAELETQAREVSELLSEATKAMRPVRGKALGEGQRQAMEQAITQIKARWGARVAEEVRPILASVMEGAAESAATEVGADFAGQREAIRALIEGYSFKFAESISAETERRVRSAIDRAIDESLTISETRSVLMETVTGADYARANAIARTETIRATNAGAEASYREAGIERKRWIAAGDSCPYCVAMEGQVESIGSAFFKVGDSFSPDGADRPLRIDYDAIHTPPLHPNCRCAIVAEVEEAA